MSEAAITTQSRSQKVGWWILFVISVLACVNHFALIFVNTGEEVLFIGWLGMSLFAAVVLYFPYRRGEKWAWYSIWIFILAFAALILFDSAVGIFYLAAAGLMALGQVLAWGSFGRA